MKFICTVYVQLVGGFNSEQYESQIISKSPSISDFSNHHSSRGSYNLVGGLNHLEKY